MDRAMEEEMEQEMERQAPEPQYRAISEAEDDNGSLAARLMSLSGNSSISASVGAALEKLGISAELSADTQLAATESVEGSAEAERPEPAEPSPADEVKKTGGKWTPERIAASKAVTFESIRNKISVIRDAYETKEYDSAKYRNAFLLLTNCYFGLKKAPLEERMKMRAEVADILIEAKIIPVMAKIFSEIVDQGLPTYFETDGKFNMGMVRSARMVLAVLFNYTDASTALAKEVGEQDDFLEALLKIVRDLRTPLFNNKLHEDLRKLVRVAISTAYNLVMQDTGTDLIDRMHDNGLVPAVIPYLNSENESVRGSALLYTIYVVNEEEAQKHCNDDKSLEFVLKNLKLALKDPYKRGRGYSNTELLRALAKLAALDVNKKKLADLGALELMQGALETGDAEEVQASLEILWQLAFHPDNAARIKASMLPLVEAHAGEDASPGTHKAANGLLWVIEEKAGDADGDEAERQRLRLRSARVRSPREPAAGEDLPALDGRASKRKNKKARFFNGRSSSPPGTPPPPLPVPPAPGGGHLPSPPPPATAAAPEVKHIMISYEWGNKPKILQLRDFIASNGHKVWLDVSDMGDNTLDSMAYAVENAWLVLLSVSRKYKESQNCRLEAEYAHRQHKTVIPLMLERYRPDGWLGILVGAKMYYDFSGKYPFDMKASELLKAINKLIGGDAELDLKPVKSKSVKSEVDGVAPPIPRMHSAEQQAAPRTRNVDYLDGWDPDNISKWCQENNIDWTHLLSVSGKELKFLIRVQRESPDFFYRCLETKLNFKTLAEMAHFVEALDRL